jgi:selenocysteine lyase/cysteine desulfurase
VVIFCTPRRAELLRAQLKTSSYQMLSSQDIGLPLGIRALAVARKALPGGIPFQTGGGNARLVSPGSVIWAGAPDRFEAGTPAIINIIAFARALQLISDLGNDAFRYTSSEKLSAGDMLYHDELEDFTGKDMLNELKKNLIGRNSMVPTPEGIRPYVNLDHAASTPTFKPVWNTVRHTWRQSLPMQHEIIREVRSVCAEAMDASPEEYDIVFTSNTTEAINLAAENLSLKPEAGIETVVLNTLLEHNSNELPWRMNPQLSLIRLDVDAEGFVEMKTLETILCAHNREGRYGNKRIRLVALCGASNVLGTYNNLEEISRMVHQYGAQLLVDAAQMAAHRKVEMNKCNIDYLVFSAHKVYAPFGTGVLVVRKGLLHFSAEEMEVIRSSGEENAGGIAALGKALVLLQRAGMDLIREKEQALTTKVLQGLDKIPGLEIYGIKDPQSPRFSSKGGVIVFNLKSVMPNKVAKALSEKGGIGVRYGYHCAHMLIKHLYHIPPFLQRFQQFLLSLLPKLSLPGMVRVSLGIGNTEADIERLIQVLENIAGQKRKNEKGKTGLAQDRRFHPSNPDIQQQIKDFTRAATQKVYAQQH